MGNPPCLEMFLLEGTWSYLYIYYYITYIFTVLTYDTSVCMHRCVYIYIYGMFCGIWYLQPETNPRKSCALWEKPCVAPLSRLICQAEVAAANLTIGFQAFTACSAPAVSVLEMILFGGTKRRPNCMMRDGFQGLSGWSMWVQQAVAAGDYFKHRLTGT